ncbi:MAG: XdhC family protein [Rhodospirillaceae bacterium]|jgi:xanthine dehydrogenase accessory factor|nr:XdhC family protein [Rhodospirillaceae bacterium]MBT5244722.1 XdhC family protein [Rhodospirillaceae bacterium]MBT5562463.1 XdhC family protein [Rhodospirillaceae bacterium]MBT6242101.1 XdhC family protein [Rhodospirillaceae bacterium]MBT7136508.1 XdhC family protein [Rhodospirillaceae bacterium]
MNSEILQQALDWLEQGHTLAMATVVSTWGSSPRPVGAQLIINDKGDFAGSVSGGCIESFVVSEAIDIIADGGVLNLEYGVSDEMAREVRLACGGDIKVFVERCPERAMLEKLRDSQPIARVVDTQSGKTALLDHDNLEGDLDDQKLSDARLLLKHGTSGSIGSKFVKVYARPRNLVIVGAVHIAQTLAPMAAAIGFHVSVIDPRPKFATPERLPGVTIITDRPAMAVDHIALDNWAAVVALAHDPLLDDPVLVAALKSDAYYIGCLGSRKTHAARLQRLRSQGFAEVDFERLHGPVGLDIGGKSPGEIAVSILAEIIAVGNGKHE